MVEAPASVRTLAAPIRSRSVRCCFAELAAFVTALPAAPSVERLMSVLAPRPAGRLVHQNGLDYEAILTGYRAGPG